jgi:hypothetical protein
MTKEDIIRFQTSLAVFKMMDKAEVISHNDFLKVESLLANKYCIKKGSIYRENDLIFSRKRVMYILPNQEVQDVNEDSKQNRCATTVTKKT